MKDAGGEIETKRLFVSHSPYLAKPDAVVAYLRRAAGENSDGISLENGGVWWGHLLRKKFIENQIKLL